MSTPATAGPSERREGGAALDHAVRLRHRRSSSPDELGQDRPLRCEVRRHEAAEERDDRQEEQRKLSRSAACSSGIEARIGARAKSATSIVVRDPRRCDDACRSGSRGSAIGAISAARTRLIFPGEPVVTRTNQGSARYVMRVPRTEIDLGQRRARSRRSSSPASLALAHRGSNIKRPYGFVKYERDAEDLRGAQGGAPRADPRRRAPLLRRARLRGGDGRPARGGDRPLARRDLQLLRLEGGPVRRARGRGRCAGSRSSGCTTACARCSRRSSSTDPEWLSVYLELIRRVRTDRAFREQIEQRQEAVVPVNRERAEEAQRTGEFRGDVEAQEIGLFVEPRPERPRARSARPATTRCPVDLVVRLLEDAIGGRSSLEYASRVHVRVIRFTSST